MESSYTEVFAWGSDEQGQLGLGENRSKNFYSVPRCCSFNTVLLEISCGKDHSAMIAQNGWVYSMGSNSSGKLGTNAKSKLSVSPSLVEGLIEKKALKVSCGFNHTAVATSEGEIYVWGDNTNGQLGSSNLYSSPTPIKVDFKKDNFVDVSCGNYHTVCLNNAGQVFSFGMGSQGQLGLGTLMDKECQPQQMRINSKVTQIAGANFYTLMLSAEGQVYGCGDNSGGQLGIPLAKSTQNVLQPQKAVAAGLDRVTIIKIAAKSFSAVLTSNNELIAFGTTVFGEYQTPRPITLRDLGKIVNIAIGNNFGIACDQSGKVCSWGVNTQGQLATNSTSPRDCPQLIQALIDKRVHKLAAGESHVISFGFNSGLTQSRSHSRLSSERPDSGKISRQQSAAQLSQLLNNRDRESGKLKSHAERIRMRSKQSEGVGNHTEAYVSRDEALQQQLYVSNQRSITPTNPLRQSGNYLRTPVQSNLHQDFSSQQFQIDPRGSSVVGSNTNLLRQDSYGEDRMKYQPQARKTEDRCKSDYQQNSVKNQTINRQIDPQSDLNRQILEQQKTIKELKNLLQDKENHIIVVQSESNDNKLKLTRRIRILEDELEQQKRKNEHIAQLEDDIRRQADENSNLRKENNELRQENIRLRGEIEHPRPPTATGIKIKHQREETMPKHPKNKSQDDSDSFLFSGISESTPQQQNLAQKRQDDKLAKLKYSPIKQPPMKTLIPQELEDHHLQTLANHHSQQTNLNSSKHNSKSQDPHSRDFRTVEETTPPRPQKENQQVSPPRVELPKPTQSTDFQKANWWSNDKKEYDKKEYGRAQTGLKQRESNISEIPTSASNTKQSLNVIKSRISDLQRNKSALENRMKSFEERMKQKRIQQD